MFIQSYKKNKTITPNLDTTENLKNLIPEKVSCGMQLKFIDKICIHTSVKTIVLSTLNNIICVVRGNNNSMLILIYKN